MRAQLIARLVVVAVMAIVVLYTAFEIVPLLRRVQRVEATS